MKPSFTNQHETAAPRKPGQIGETAIIPLCGRGRVLGGGFLGNKVVVGSVNANRLDYEAAVRDLALAEAQFSGWLPRLLTHPVKGLDNYKQAFDQLTGDPRPIKVFVEVARED